MSQIVEILIGVVILAFGWLLKAGYDNWVKKVDGKMDKDCHDICSKNRDETNKMMLEEIKANRKIALDILQSNRTLIDDFREKSELVIKAVEK